MLLCLVSGIVIAPKLPEEKKGKCVNNDFVTKLKCDFHAWEEKSENIIDLLNKHMTPHLEIVIAILGSMFVGLQ